MKRTFYTLLLFAFLFQACSLKSPYGDDYLGYYYAIGTAEKNGNVSSITSDDLKTVMLKGKTFPDSVVDLRVFADGKAYQGSGGFDFVLEADRCLLVIVKEAQCVENQSIIDKKNNANIIFDYTSVVQTGKYLNIFLDYFAANTKKHSFDFLINKEKEHFEDNKVTINICHNDGGDEIEEKFYSVFSLDLTNLFEKFDDDFDIVLAYMENSHKKEALIKIKNLKPI